MPGSGRSLMWEPSDFYCGKELFCSLFLHNLTESVLNYSLSIPLFLYLNRLCWESEMLNYNMMYDGMNDLYLGDSKIQEMVFQSYICFVSC
jgi:hypothetical protein